MIRKLTDLHPILNNHPTTKFRRCHGCITVHDKSYQIPGDNISGFGFLPPGVVHCCDGGVNCSCYYGGNRYRVSTAEYTRTKTTRYAFGLHRCKYYTYQRPYLIFRTRTTYFVLHYTVTPLYCYCCARVGRGLLSRYVRTYALFASCPLTPWEGDPSVALPCPSAACSRKPVTENKTPQTNAPTGTKHTITGCRVAPSKAPYRNARAAKARQGKRRNGTASQDKAKKGKGKERHGDGRQGEVDGG